MTAIEKIYGSHKYYITFTGACHRNGGFYEAKMPEMSIQVGNYKMSGKSVPAVFRKQKQEASIPGG